MTAALALMFSPEQTRQQVYDRLRRAASGEPNSEWLARMLASRAAGIGSLPERLGLTSRQFGAMLALHFHGFDGRDMGAGAEMDLERAPERHELRQLFLSHAVDIAPERVWMADILIAGCMGADHLWQDLGLWSRDDLSALLAYNFPALKRKNDRDMKWKKFLYRQLCVQEGLHLCRSPSCETCDDFKRCFAPEE